VTRGEVVGLIGLVGAGRSTLMRALAGLEGQSSGHLDIDGVPVRFPRTTRSSIEYGIVMTPEDRKEGLVLGMTLRDNVVLGFGKPWQFALASIRGVTARKCLEGFGAAKLVGRLGDPVKALSGGNQQKALIARSAARASLLLADEPTRGIDIAAKGDVLETLRALADDGTAVLFSSSDFEDVLAISDRVVVMAHGAPVFEMERGDAHWNVKDATRAAFGVDRLADPST
jgi:ABC-type sugar transport system ATPase subunit